MNDRSPVILGVGEVNDYDDRLPAPALAAAASRLAERDCGRNLMSAVEWVGIVDSLSWAGRPAPMHPEVCRLLDLSPAEARSSPSPSGNEPVRLLEDAANAIADGQIRLALIAGGEAMRTTTRAARARTGSDVTGTDLIRAYRQQQEHDLLRRYGLLTPIDVYPIYEQATRAAWGQSLAQAQAETATIWAGLARIAAANPNAWSRAAPSEEQIINVTPGNPMVTFPYTRSMVPNAHVNQGAALLIGSLGLARELDWDESQLVHVGYGAAAHEAAGNLDRANFACSPSMETVLGAALERNGMTTADLDMVELYSCFPCVPKMARRILGWPAQKPHSIYGGLSFGGGPIGNCMTHAIAAYSKLARFRASRALIFANGGFATRNHAILLSSEPSGEPRRAASYDVQAEADRRRGPVPPLVADHCGSAILESYSIPFDRSNRPKFATLVLRTPSGQRCLARAESNEEMLLETLMSASAEPIGLSGEVKRAPTGLLSWRPTN